ncbi:dihydropteroate synthase [Coxiella endosymbiont of Amblyomma americanum]|uniref:dihydropteroate synthase n=1 Tax=Coxiella endosymbiont of Amblyomma americanum TaxID=325775 RepID=UPI00057FB152|nr:dihydropteroate synthase [Coxiella endosymbiont of Amblyomma americanum]AJC50533.1 dihydropteroate synthase [Coxiella endosymbiont of Amblyomma americanum]AUJ58868.1 dihydropteroate synthase [Coxiella-like endosymbiont of Amblyomma americanum]
MKNIKFCLYLRGNRKIVFSKPAIMGIINVSPNSFYNPYVDLSSTFYTAEKMVHDGVDILDVGGEATNPLVNISTDSPSLQVELDRLIPAIEGIKKRFDILISVDTSRPQVMKAAINVGADIINDQRALQNAGALETVKELNSPVCLMHFGSESKRLDSSTCTFFLTTVKKDLQAIVERCENHGISRNQMIIDLGFGQGHYGKSLKENFYLLNHLSEFLSFGLPILSGWSRKSMIGDVLLTQSPKDRLFGSIAADVLAVYQGASIIRTHDVKASREAVYVADYARRLM